ncbi:MAG: TonB-dependent receptor [Granulosicoccaceae bacterium]|jgi:iron complex outermembrane receptor protein
MLYRCRRSAAGVLAAILFYSIPSSADELFSEQTLFEALPIVSATRLSQQPRDLPVAITVFTRDEIAASGVTDIPDIIRLVPGFRVGKVNGNYYSVVGHGPGDQLSRHLQILIDGRPIFSPFLSTVDWAALPITIDDVERIEVMRGPSASVYGANAYNGVINIVTSRPVEHRGLYVRTLHGERDTGGVHVRYGFNSEKMDHAISLNYRDDEGFPVIHDGRRFTKLFYRGNLQLDFSNEIDIQAGFAHGFGEEPEYDPNLLRERERINTSNFQHVQWRHTYDNGDEMQLRLYHNYEDIDDFYNTTLLSTAFGLPPAAIPFLFDGQPDQSIRFGFFPGSTRRLGLEYQRTYNFEDLKFVWGAGMTQDTLESDVLFYGKNRSEDASKQLFASMEWFVRPNLSLNAGALLEHTNGINPRLSPRVSLNYHLNENHTFRIGAARAYRMQTAYEKDAFVVSTFADGSPLDYIFDYRDFDQPEHVSSFEIAHIANFPAHHLSLDWRIYKEKYRNVLASIKDRDYTPLFGATDAEIAGDAGNYKIKGFEFQAKYKPSAKNFIALQYSYADPEGTVISGINPTTYSDLWNAMPKNVFSVLVSKELPWGLQGSLAYLDIGGSRWFGLGYTLPGYEVLDLRLAKDFRVGGTEARAELLVQNALDDNYQDFSEFNIAESVVLLRLSLWQR